jgi:hypothetical protein
MRCILLRRCWTLVYGKLWIGIIVLLDGDYLIYNRDHDSVNLAKGLFDDIVQSFPSCRGGKSLIPSNSLSVFFPTTIPRSMPPPNSRPSFSDSMRFREIDDIMEQIERTHPQLETQTTILSKFDFLRGDLGVRTGSNHAGDIA